MKNEICQSCGMPLDYDPEKGGTNADLTKSDKFCSFCYSEGRFIDGCNSLQDKIDKNVAIAVEKMNMPIEKARELAETVLPSLERWK